MKSRFLYLLVMLAILAGFFPSGLPVSAQSLHRIAFVSTSNGDHEIFVMNADGSDTTSSSSLFSEILRPMADGSEKSIDYPASPASHWDKVADVTPDDEGSYIKNQNGAAGSWQRDLFALQNHVGSGTIVSVKVYIRARHNVSDAKASIRTNNQTFDSPALGAGSAWGPYSYTWTTNPSTNSTWTWDEINALEAGVSLQGSIAAPDWSDATQVYVEVNYYSSDSIPPVAVSNLATANLTANSVLLTWTAPGDNGTEGQSFQYDIRRAGSAITDNASFDAATVVPNNLVPQVAGSSENFTVTGLSANTTYFFALKTRDFAGNWSEVSNSPSITTPSGGGGGGGGGSGSSIKIMTRNLYLGADLGPVLASPTPQNVEAVFAKVHTTNFTARAGALADEIQATQPDLIGLQEAALWRTQTPGDNITLNATDIVYDFVQILLDKLATRGLAYTVASIGGTFQAELPGIGRDIRFGDRNVILARTSTTPPPPLFSNWQKGVFNADVYLPTINSTVTRGWVSVDVTTDAGTFRFINTHLESMSSSVQEAQGYELLAGPANTDAPVILVGDFNSAAAGTGFATQTYGNILALGFNDAWSTANPGVPGYTWGQSELLDNTSSNLSARIDLILSRGPFSVTGANVTGNTTSVITETVRWASDHAGVVADLALGAPGEIGGATVSISVPAEVVAGANFTAFVNINNVSNLDAATYDVVFNPALLELVNVTAGIPVDLWTPITAGRYRIINNLPGPSLESDTGVSGNVSLAILHFRVIGPSGQFGSITLSNGVLSDYMAQEIPASWVGDAYTTTKALTRIDITPANSTINLGRTQQFTATGTYSDNSTANVTGTATWTSTNPLVATIESTGQPNPGLAHSVAIGPTTIRATFGGITGSTTLTVNNKILDSIIISPDNQTIALGRTLQFSATGFFSDGSNSTVPAEIGIAAWTSNNTTVATITNTGLAQSLAEGQTTISVNTTAGVFDTTTLTVGPKVLDTVVVTPADPIIALGEVIQFSALGIYSDSSSENLTATANWTSSNTAVADIGLNTGLATTANKTAGWTKIEAQWGEKSGKTKLTVAGPRLNSIIVTPDNQTIALGRTLQFTVMGTFSDGSTVNLTSVATWTSSSPGVATIQTAGQANPGLAQSLSVGGPTQITATWGGRSDNTNLDVVPEVIQRLIITPPNPTIARGRTIPFTAWAHYSNGVSVNVTGNSTWGSSNVGVATIDSTGLAAALTIGTTNISATYTGTGFTGTTFLTVISPTLESIAITPETPTVVAGETLQLTLTGTHSDTVSANLTSFAIWSSSSPSVAKISDTGLVEGFKVGTSNITAYFGGLRDWVLVTITPALSATLPPTVVTGRATSVTHNSTILNGYLLGLGSATSVNVSFEWGTNNITYGNNTTIQIMTAAGAFNTTLTGLSPNTTYHFRAKATGNVTAPVTGLDQTFTTRELPPPVLGSIQVTPNSASVAAGRTSQFNATGTYSYGPTQNITAIVAWSSSDNRVASISHTGLATGHSPGVVTITATRGGISGTATLTVTSAELETIRVFPVDPTIQLGSSQQFRAIGIYTNRAKSDITTLVNWTSSIIAVADIGINTGLATTAGKIAGWTLITAQSGSISGTSNLTSTAATLESVVVTTSTPSVAAGEPAWFTATGNFIGGFTANITSLATWSSSDNTVAKVAHGLVITYAPGVVTITAAYGGLTGSANLTVTQPIIRDIIVTPKNPRVIFLPEEPPQIQFTATVVYSDRSTRDITGTANWTSQNLGVATIQTSGNTTPGLATTTGHGATKITATWSGVEGFTNLTVLPDRVAPRVRLTSPTEGMILANRELTVSGSINDRNATANLTLNGVISVLSLSEGSFSTRVLLNFGRNSVRVDAVDRNGNVGTSGTITVIVVDTTRVIPAITINQPASGSVTNNSSATITGNITGNFTQATMTFNGRTETIAVTGGSFNVAKTLINGTNTIVVKAYAAGMAGVRDYLGTSGVVTVTLDTIGPRVTIDSPVAFSIVGNAGIEVSGRVDDPSVFRVRLILNRYSSNQSAPQFVEVNGGNFSQGITLPLPGTNTITVEATDEAGNTGVAFAWVTFDNTYPQVAVTTPINGLVTNTAVQTISGSVDDPTIASVTVRRAPIPAGGSVGAGDVTFPDIITTIPVMPDGTFSKAVTLTTGIFEVTATDAAGHTGSSGWMWVEIDNTAPVITIHISDPNDSVTITVNSSETLTETPTVLVESTGVNMTRTDVNVWSGIFAPLEAGQDYQVSVNATDRAGNRSTATASFAKQAITVDGLNPTSVTTPTADLQVETNGAVSGNISVTNHQGNPAGNAINSDASNALGVFLEIVASPEIADNLRRIYIRVEYNPAEIPTGTDPATLKLYLWDVASGTWQVVPDSRPITVDGRYYIEGYIDHLSKYGAFGAARVNGGQPTTGGGGGGGGGGGDKTALALDGLTTTVTIEVDSNGITSEAGRLATLDQKVSLDVAKGTKLLDAQGNKLSSLSASKLVSPAAPPSGQAIILAYELGPAGARFELTTIVLTMSYDATTLPQGASEKELYLAYWDGTKWVALASTVDIQAKKVSAPISHFTQFALIAKLPPPPPPPTEPAVAPAKFAIDSLSITPTTVDSAEPVTISVVVSNTGGSEGKYTVILKINGIEEDRKEITLGAGKSLTVSFSIAKAKEGSYTVSIDDKTGQFTVTAVAPSATPPPVKPAINWTLILGIIGGVVILGLVLWLAVFRRRAY